MLARDPGLLEQLERLTPSRYEGRVYRVVWSDRSPLQGSSGKSGRWNSPNGAFEILNTSVASEGADAEFESFWSLFEQRPDRKALNWTLNARLRLTVRLDFEALYALGVRQAGYAYRDYTRTQEISDGLNYLGYHGVLVPSARYACENLVVYMQNFDEACSLDEERSSVFQWTAE